MLLEVLPSCSLKELELAYGCTARRANVDVTEQCPAQERCKQWITDNYLNRE